MQTTNQKFQFMLLAVLLGVAFLVAFALEMPSAFAFSPGVEQLAIHENEDNGAFSKPKTLIKAPHLEIPLEMVDVDLADRIDPRTARSLVFKGQDGKLYVRWILNPDDTKWGQEIIEAFAARGVKLEKKYYFRAYRTASRSLIIEDPLTGAQFSTKTSTNIVYKTEQNKRQRIGEAMDAKIIADYIHDVSRGKAFKHFAVMDEPGVLSLPELDHAVVLRALGPLTDEESNVRYLPAFAALNDDLGVQIALKNGSNDPYRFWTENYIKPVARAMAELAARTGLQLSSPHVQNILIELDRNNRPTGRIVFRDLSDIVIDEVFLKATYPDAEKLLRRFSQTKRNVARKSTIRFIPVSEEAEPNWLNSAQKLEWNQVFLSQVESSLREVTGSPMKRRIGLAGVKTIGPVADYSFAGDEPQLKSYLKRLRERWTQERLSPADAKGQRPGLCSAAFSL